MKASEFKEKIKVLVKQVYKDRNKADDAALPYDELTKFPQLKLVIIDLLTSDFDSFIASIDWVAPRPTTFRVNLQNDEEFYLIWMRRSWIAQVEGKKYYLLNLPEEERAAQAIARLLRYGPPETEGEAGGDDAGFGDAGGEEAGGGEEVDVTVDDTTDVEVDA